MPPGAKAILKRMERREYKDEDRHEAHKAWMRSPEGQRKAAVMVKEFKSLSPEERALAAGVAACTGDVEAVPLIIAGLSDRKAGKEVVNAVRYASRMGAKEDFRKAVAPHVLRWLPKARDLVVSALPRLDASLAAEALLGADFLKDDPVLTTEVLKAFNEAGQPVPLAVAEASLAIHLPAMKKSRGGGPAFEAWREALFALAAHKPEEAVALAEKIATKWRGCDDSLSEVFLHANGLRNLYDRLCDVSDDPQAYARLPEPARIYYATTYFLADWENGGLSQVFGNSTGDLAEEAKKGFLIIGAERDSRILDEVWSWFGPDGPSPNRSLRQHQMDNMEPSFWDREERMDEQESKGRVNRQHEPSPWWLLKRWAARNAEVLRPLVA